MFFDFFFHLAPFHKGYCTSQSLWRCKGFRGSRTLQEVQIPANMAAYTQVLWLKGSLPAHCVVLMPLLIIE